MTTSTNPVSELEKFKSKVFSSDLARPNRFNVEIPLPTLLSSRYKDTNETLNLFCEETNFPPLIVSTKAYRIFGPSYQLPTSVEFGGEGISMSFHVDTEMKIKKIFEDWIDIIVSLDNYTVTYAYDKNDNRNYLTDIKINQLNAKDEIKYTCKLFEAFPRSMNVMPLNNSLQNQTHRLTVMFAYRYWKKS